MRAEALGGYAHQEAPFERVVERLRPARALDRSPIFQVMLALDNTPHEEARLGSLRVGRESVSSGAAKYDLSLLLEEREGGVAGVWLYDADLFNEATVRGLAERYARLLEGAAADPSRRVSQLPLLTEEERQRQLTEWNDTHAPFPAESCFHELFERQARLTPDTVAVVGEDGQFTYAELDARADRLARRLRSLGVRPESRVALLMERGAEMLAALLGVLKAGGAYVPLDPSYPQERLAFMLEDSGAEVLLTRGAECEVPGGAARVIDVAEVWGASEVEDSDAEGSAGKAEPENLAYVIYTSGSTGRPKGVCVPHRALVNYTLGVAERLGLSGGLSFALVSTPAADLGHTALFPSLCTGGSLHVIARERAADAAALGDYFVRHGVDCLKIVPSHLAALLAGDGAGKVLPRRRLILGGEASGWGLVRRARELAPGCEVFNHYGPTETTVGVLTYGVVDTPTRDEAGRVPLGRPLPNVRVYVLDSHLNPVPVGAAGELYVGGAQLARGYLGRAGATAERFVPDPLSGEAGARLYRTGDLARYLADGNLEFLGRADGQVKVSGFRVELGEVEAALRSHPLVHGAAVLAWEERPGEVSLAAYVVAEPGAQTVERGELRRFLSDKLPRHMLPVVYTFLEELPLTPNGKVNRRALPTPERETQKGVGAPEPPRTPTEESLAAMWGELLGVERVGVADDFFELGGHSLLATRLVARVRERFGVELALRKIFETPTVRGLAAEVDGALGREGSGVVRIERRDEEGPAPLSYAQQRLWFLDRLQPGSPFYNLPGAVHLRGALDVKAFERSLNEVVRRHDMLRTSFKTVEGEPVQVVSPSLFVPLPVTDLSSLPDDEREAKALRLSEEEAARPFDLAAGTPLRAQLLRLGEREHVFLLTLHHIVADGWSMGLLVQEVAALYEAFTGGDASPLPELSIQYADFAQWQRRRLAEGVLERDLAYWERQLAGAPDMLTLPTDRPRPPVQSHRGATFEFALSPELTAALKELSRGEGATLFMTLLAGFAVLLQRHAGQDDVLVGTPVAGRQQEETERLIGLFINMLVLRADLSGDPTFRQLLGQMRELALEAYTHQEAPFERVVERLRPSRALDRSPLFQVMLAFDNTPQEVLRLGELAAERVPLRGGSAKYDLTFSLEEGEAGLRGVVEYRTDIFDEATVRALAGRYEVLLEGAAADPTRRVSELPLLTEEERHRQLVEWNDTSAPFPTESCVHEPFERQVQSTPDAVALVFEGESLTYAELNEKADALASRLRRMGVGAESRVGVLLERSTELVVALLGVLKAGGCYVPLDPEYPEERLRFMAEDAGLALVLTSARLSGLAEGWGVGAWVVGAEGAGDGEADDRQAGGKASPDNLAYVIYTSGSTGRPKGVCVSHRNVVNLLAAMDEKLGGGEPGVWLAITSVSFDISVLELFWTLARGFKVVLQGRLDLMADAGEPAGGASEKALDFSLFYFASDDNTGGDDIYELLLEGAKFADEHGFSAVWTPERHFHAFGGTYPNPSVTSAAVAAVTRRVEIRAGSVVIPLHDPLRVAEEWAMVDNISRGRVAISFASGWHANDFVLAPDVYENRHEVMYRNIELVRRLWRGEPVMRRTGAGNEIEVRVHPRPVQPELRFWITAAGNPETFRTAGRIGANLLTHLLGQTVAELGEKIKVYREAWRENGHGPGEGHVTLMLHTFVGCDLEAVREIVRAPFSNYLRSSISLLRHSARSLGRDLDSGRVTEADMEAVLAHAFDRYFGTAALLGTPESCLPMIERLKSVGVDEVGCLIDFGVEQKEVLASLPQLTELKERSNRRRRSRGYSLAAQLREHSVTHLQLTPSMARLLLADEETTAAMRGLRKLLVGGEALSAALARQLRERLGCEVRNMYGPTETTVWSTEHEVGEAGEAVPIGRPIANTTVRILDRNLRLAPAGVPGEIYLGGEGVARGYLNRPALTAERFVPDPFSTKAGERLYRTGDVAHYLSDGSIEFLGRADNQVKVRGFRVELGEIEAALRGCPGVREAVVVAREDASGEKRLLAYIVPSAGDAAAPTDGDKPTPATLRGLLHEKLPSHLVPSAFSFLEELPLTPNGKVDRKALPDPTGPGADAGVAPPRSEAEQTIAAIWRDVLKLESVGVNDNFFEIGGTSLLVVQVNGRLREAFGRDVPIVEMFRHPTVGTLARFIEGGGDERPSFGQAQSRAARQAEAMSRQQRATQGRPTRRPPVRPR
ncbi:MAG: amino acid adenylation domain-containing protein [Pyrinomonadaceae bacterium]